MTGEDLLALEGVVAVQHETFDHFDLVFLVFDTHRKHIVVQHDNLSLA